MARKATGQVVAPDGERQQSWALRFRAYGKRRFLTLGRPEDGWNREGAETELRHVLADVERGIWQTEGPAPAETPQEIPTFHEFATEWYRSREARWRPNTRADYMWALQHLLPYFKDHRLTEITVEEVDRYASTKQSEGDLSNNSINSTLTRLSQILEIALDYEKIARNPAKGKKRRLPAEARLRSWVEPEQLFSLLAGCGPELRVLVAVLTGTGLRISEAMALVWDDINLAVGTIRVTDAKTAAGYRIVDIPAGARSELRVHKARSPKTAPSDPVFLNQQGNKQTVRNAQERLKPAIRKANRKLPQEVDRISEDVTPHSLRRTYASMRFALGDDPVYVAAQMGHTEASFSMRVYAQAVKRRERLSGEHLREFDKALEWAGTGRETVRADSADAGIGLPERIAP